MPNPIACHAMQKVLELSSIQEGELRLDFLKLVCELHGEQRCAALLWLWDPEWRVLVLNSYHSPMLDVEAPAELMRREATPNHSGNELLSGNGELCPGKTDFWRVNLHEQPEVLAWAEGLGITANCKFTPLSIRKPQPPTGSPEEICIGFVQFLSQSQLSDEISDCLRFWGAGLASAITRQREQGHFAVLRELSRGDAQLDRNKEEWLQLAVVQVAKRCSAQFALALAPRADMNFEAKATYPLTASLRGFVAHRNSLTHRISQSKEHLRVRLRTFQDPNELLRVFGHTEFDHKLAEAIADALKGPPQSWLAMTVKFGRRTSAVIMLWNKTTGLTRSFSHTDSSILEAACKFLGDVLPSVESYQAIQTLSKVDYSDLLDNERTQQKAFSQIGNLVTGIASLAIVHWPHIKESPKGMLLLQVGEKCFDPNAPLPGPTADVAPIPESQIRDPDIPYYFATTIPTIENGRAFLYLALRRSWLSDFAKAILIFFVKELSHVLRTHDHSEKVKGDFAQIRHAIRANLMGVVGYIQEAKSSLEIQTQQARMIPAVQTRLRKAFGWAYFYAARTSTFLDSTRFLLGNITRDSLKLNGASLRTSINTIINSLRPLAEDRRIDLKLVDQLPQGRDQVNFDQQLIDMMVFNVVENAIKYSYRDKDVIVALTFRSSNWVLTVTDYGEHIQAKDLAPIFRPYERRSPGGHSTPRPGTGLGLPVAKAIAEAHGGRIEATSIKLQDTVDAPAETIFTVIMPRSPS